MYFKHICFVLFFFQGTQKLSSLIGKILEPVQTHPSFCAVGSEGKSHRAQSQQGGDSSILLHFPLLEKICPLLNFEILTSLVVSNWASNSEARPLEL